MKWALFSAAVFAAAALVEGRPGNAPRPTTTRNRCLPIVTPTTPPTSTTEPPESSTSIPPSCVNTPGSTLRVTRTLAFEDIDSLAASRVPIPDGYNGFSHSDPANNKVYRSGPPPVSISGPNVLYANNGRLELGAVGFPWNPQYFHVLTFLDPDNGITKATVRVGGVLVNGFETEITADRSFVKIEFPPFDRITAVNLIIEVFANDGSSGQRLPFWLDDFVYVRREWQVTCCQLDNPNKINKLTFDDLRSGKKAPNKYKSFTLSPRNDLQITGAPANNPSKPNALYKKASSAPLSITSTSGPFNLLSLTLTISQYSPPPFNNIQTRILILGFSPSGSQIGSWDIPAATYQPGTYSIHLGGDWQIGNTGGLYINGRTGGGGRSGYFSSGGFRSVSEVRVQVYEQEFPGGQMGGSTPKAFWVDDFEWQKPAGCEEDF